MQGKWAGPLPEVSLPFRMCHNHRARLPGSEAVLNAVPLEALQRADAAAHGTRELPATTLTADSAAQRTPLAVGNSTPDTAATKESARLTASAMDGDCVKKPLALLEKAGRMDLVNREARKAAQGVAAAVLACSPPRFPIRAEQEGNRGQAEPGEPRAALIPWRKEKSEPRAAGRSSSTGGQVKRILATDAPKGRCGGMGFAPASVAASEELRPGPSGMRWGPAARLGDVDLVGEWLQ
ncbi:hypothetical protein NDU88_004288 [Pleurodeles waltl]|uniref:Uncharacterized protein n=1 Tax=Pleurodeles waltl TaxID=8319 RepID=A0AAV7TT26_PLEWA|nr:hypothetical protein NDU88_004288 [Pleurodeles waltl]